MKETLNFQGIKDDVKMEKYFQGAHLSASMLPSMSELPLAVRLFSSSVACFFKIQLVEILEGVHEAKEVIVFLELLKPGFH